MTASANTPTPLRAVPPPPSPGPWQALILAPTVSGAVLIVDAHNEIVGWATDTAGHTSETVAPEGRSPSAIATNAAVLAAAHEMRAVLALIQTAEPLIAARMTRHGLEPHREMTEAGTRARELLARIEVASRIGTLPWGGEAAPNRSLDVPSVAVPRAPTLVPGVGTASYIEKEPARVRRGVS